MKTTNRQWVDEVLADLAWLVDAEASQRKSTAELKGRSLKIINIYAKHIEEAKATINQKINQEIKDLLESLPEKVPILKTDTKYGELRSPINYREEGYNKAISEVRSIIKAKIKDKNGNS